MSERDIISKYILPAIARSGWDMQKQVREEVTKQLIQSIQQDAFDYGMVKNE